MSTDTAAAPKKESLFSKKNRRLLSDPLDDSNAIRNQVSKQGDNYVSSNHYEQHR